MQATALVQADPAAVLSKALVRAAAELSLSQASLARVLGVSAATVSRLVAGRSLSPDSKEGELALLLLRAHRSLLAIVGGNAEAASRWFAAPNRGVGGRPAELVQRVDGLVRVVTYLDAMRGRN